MLTLFENFPNKLVYGGFSRLEKKCGFDFIGGTCIIFSPDVVNLLIKNKNKLNYKLIDV